MANCYWWNIEWYTKKGTENLYQCNSDSFGDQHVHFVKGKTKLKRHTKLNGNKKNIEQKKTTERKAVTTRDRGKKQCITAVKH